jgi:hypothetical protein
LEDRERMGGDADPPRARLAELVERLERSSVESSGELRRVRSDAFMQAGNILEGAGVDEVESIAILNDFARDVDMVLSRQWPTLFRSSQGTLFHEDH